ncbi:MAG TPA: alpha-L-fucosidase [Chthonomonadales bacterium]|nr:alpha-L-fucosidase [Chthonomonadales bacterium]
MNDQPALSIQSGPFQPTWDSLRQYRCPDWFRDAKFGIWAHWGPQCVPLCGDWYARRMYQPGDPAYNHHRRVYGHPSKVGYKDIVPLWKAERFDPDALMDRYVAAGARYFVAQAVHHDNFDNWDSRHHRWNAVRVGPMRDIVGAWREAASRRGLRFGVSEHLGACFSWMRHCKDADPDGAYAGVPYDGNDPAYEDLYLPNRGEGDAWYTANPWWHARWFERMKDLVDQHQPDLFYSDGGVPFGETGLSLIAHLYNSSAARHGANEAVYTQKDTNPDVYRVGLLDIERGQRPDIAEHPWQTDTCVGGWFFDSRLRYKTPEHVVEMLVDIVSKNGCLLLNLTQMPDGSLDDECLHILDVLAAWTAANGEGIFGTRPWETAGEGPTKPESGAFREDRVRWTVEDFRFTRRAETVYAFQMRAPESRVAAIRALGRGAGRTVKAVRMAGRIEPVRWEQTEQALVLTWPAPPPGGCVPCAAVMLG